MLSLLGLGKSTVPVGSEQPAEGGHFLGSWSGLAGHRLRCTANRGLGCSGLGAGRVEAGRCTVASRLGLEAGTEADWGVGRQLA